ncbi:MAG: M4 family metallopeptidase [Candidatus Latescibacteria bacterium]|nr:M4 family metallopeptidase [Candidatus Latescibacterota bacterium]
MNFNNKSQKPISIYPLLTLLLMVFTFTPSASYAYSPAKADRTLSMSGKVFNKPDKSSLAKIGERISESISSGTNSAGKTSALKAQSDIQSGLHKDSITSTPFYIDSNTMEHLNPGAEKNASGVTSDERALIFLESNKNLFLLDSPRDELELISSTVTSDGRKHVKFQQIYRGLRIWGQQLVIHFDSNDTPYSFNGRYVPTPSNLDPDGMQIQKNAAIETAMNNLSSTKTITEFDQSLKTLLKYPGPESELTVWVDKNYVTPHIAWRVLIRPNIRDQWQYFIDAYSGEVLDSYNETTWETKATASALDALGVTRIINVSQEGNVYYMHDMDAAIYSYDAHNKVISSRNTPSLIQSGNNTWNDHIAVSAHANSRAVYDYYLNEHGRNGIDGEGMDLPVVVHYTENGTPLDNAFWNGSMIAFGDAHPYAAALDVVAHELTHGVVEYTVGLEYRYQSGALNESIADVMAAMVDPDWEIAEDLSIGPIRDISNPSKFGMPENMDEYENLSLDYDYGGVHINMSIPSKAAYLIAESIGREKTADIWYRTLDSRYLTSRSEFPDMRYAAIRAADDLYGVNSAESVVVADAFDAVGIYEGTSTEQPGDVAPLEGEEMIAFLSTEKGRPLIALSPPDLQNAEDIIYPTTKAVYNASSSPLTASKNGMILMYIDENNNIRMLNTKTYEETVIDDSGYWSSIKLSPNGRYLAATTVNQDSTLYVIDTKNPENSTSFHLYTASSEGVKSYTTLYADALDWDLNSATILYDAFHSIPLNDSKTVEFWDINFLDVASGIITRIKTPTDENTQVGNPSFAETNDRYIVCDLFPSDQSSAQLVTIDLNTQQMVTIRQNGLINLNYPNLGYPKYSPDDKNIIFQQYSQFYRDYVVFTLPLNDDKMTVSGNATAFYYGKHPIWFTRNENVVAVEEENAGLPDDFVLNQNRPNPFNPSTLIPFSLSSPSLVTLNVYDILGRKVATLVDETLPAGEQSVRFDASGLASGMYIYRLRVNDRYKTMKMMVVK